MSIWSNIFSRIFSAFSETFNFSSTAEAAFLAPKISATPATPVKYSDDVDTMARTLYGEARNQGRIGMTAVAAVIVKRYNLRQQGRGYSSFGPVGATISQICKAPKQFSCWNSNDPNRPKILTATSIDAAFALALQIADSALKGNLVDYTHGADSYYASYISPPDWTDGLKPVAQIGPHLFFRVSNNTGAA